MIPVVSTYTRYLVYIHCGFTTHLPSPFVTLLISLRACYHALRCLRSFTLHTPLRSGDLILRCWIAGYTAIPDGRLHHAVHVTFVPVPHRFYVILRVLLRLSFSFTLPTLHHYLRFTTAFDYVCSSFSLYTTTSTLPITFTCYLFCVTLYATHARYYALRYHTGTISIYDFAHLYTTGFTRPYHYTYTCDFTHFTHVPHTTRYLHTRSLSSLLPTHVPSHFLRTFGPLVLPHVDFGGYVPDLNSLGRWSGSGGRPVDHDSTVAPICSLLISLLIRCCCSSIVVIARSDFHLIHIWCYRWSLRSVGPVIF